MRARKLLVGVFLMGALGATTAFADAMPAYPWTFIGISASPQECRVLAKSAGFSQSLLSGYARPGYYCCYGSATATDADALVALTERTLDLVDSLRPLIDPEYDYVRYLLPVKTSAEQALAIAKTNGPSSRRTLLAIRVLETRLYEAEPLVAQLLRREDQASRFGRELIAIQEEIENRLR